MSFVQSVSKLGPSAIADINGDNAVLRHRERGRREGEGEAGLFHFIAVLVDRNTRHPASFCEIATHRPVPDG